MSTCVVIGGGGYRAVNFDGTNDHMARTSALTGASANDTGTCSFWIKTAGTGGNQTIFYMLKDGVSTISIRVATTVMYLQFARTNTSPFPLGDIISSGDVADSTWHHVVSSWDISAATTSWRTYVDDVHDGSGFRDRTGDISWDGPDIYVGKDTTGSVNRFNGDIAEFWLDSTYMDLSNSANRRKFISAGGAPVNLGSDGSVPTGSAPLIYLKGPAARFPTNLTGKGDFTVTGALTNSSTSPP
jgi:hypothetical protein